MLGSLDCMHWRWKNCPKAWAGQYADRSGSPTIILEAVADYDLWIWHAYFGMPGANNDINVLETSNLFSKLARGIAHPAHYVICGKDYNIGIEIEMRAGDGLRKENMVSVGETESPQLHVFFFPFMGHGYMIPMVDMAKLFAMSGAVKTTIVTTPLNAPFVSTTIERSKNSGINIDIKLLNFPCVEAGLPEGCENLESIPNSKGVNLDMNRKFFMAADLFQQPFEQLIQECKPDCLVVDMFFTWVTDTADKFGIHRLMFNGSSFLSLCMSESINLYQPHKKVESDSQPFVIPNLPGDLQLTKDQMPDVFKQSEENEFTENVLGRKAWHIGPVSLCNRFFEDKLDRGKKSSIDQHRCLNWLDSKQSDSVVYICFGSAVHLNAAQLKEIALAIETTGQQFIWVIREEHKEEDWLPEGFEKRMESKGLIIRGWAPQVLILEHQAIGAFFHNEKLVTEVLKIGIGVGVRKWVEVVGDFVRRDAIEKAVKEVMVGEKAEEMRSRAKALGEMAKRAVENGGSSFRDLNALIQELNSQRR
ncbi:putative UDP-glucosyl transferase 73B3 [Hibiscus syriacus]|uniref:UDP-glucosyl transferase 73B3 n=1 Tax=Hibiscus syriacus TaxID=106335 RepID=A0A6A3CBU0_HIBSY|nr:putative UDP-glucosyl transferase 73B3 [Hibiscus syriacus]